MEPLERIVCQWCQSQNDKTATTCRALVLAIFLALPAAAHAAGRAAGRAGQATPASQAMAATQGAPAAQAERSVQGMPPVDQIVARVLAAQGGREKLAAVHSRRETGRIAIGDAAPEPLSVELERPGKMHMEMAMQGKTIVRIYDGSAGWQINPFSGKSGAVAMSPEELTNISEEADFDGPLVDYRARGNQVEAAGMDKVEGKDAYKLRVTLKSGDVDVYYFAAASWLKVKWEGIRHQNGREVAYESVFHDYRTVGGLAFPFRIDSGVKGEPPSAHMTLTAIELDPALAEARFAKP